jgi:hypothetical protein
MKSKQIYEIALKIGGIVAAWKFFESLILFVIMVVTFSSTPKFGGMNFLSFFPINNLSSLMTLASALFAFLLLFRTEKVMKLLRLNNQEDEDDEANLQIERKVFYHVLVLAFGFSFLFYSANNIFSKTYSSNVSTTNTNTQQPTSTTHVNSTLNPKIKNPNVSSYSSTATTISTSYNNSKSESTTTSKTSTTNLNYISILLVVLSLLIIFKSSSITLFLLSKIPENNPNN